MPKWIEFARVVAVKQQLHAGEKIVTLRIYLPDDKKPAYALGHCLLMQWPDRNLHIFNPQKLSFSTDKLASHVQSIYGKCDSYGVVKYE